MEFKDLGLNKQILRVLYEQEYINPTPIQEKTIPKALEGNDILGLAQTGTGKTAAFALPTIQHLNTKKGSNKKRKIRALVLTPTRELALQVYESFNVYSNYSPLRSGVIFGGVRQSNQVKTLKNGVDVLIATPGRLFDLINQGHVDLSSIEIFILDEADRMLDMGFIQDIRRVVKLLPKKKQTMFFSATMPSDLQDIVEKILVDPIKITVAPVSSTIDTIEQHVCYIDKARKNDWMNDFFKEKKGESVLIFTRTKIRADRLVKFLKAEGVLSKAIHGDKSQNARQQALNDFKNYKIQALVATDIASRGIDIDELGYVINYDLPEDPESYVHRIGRTGRAGHEGIAISLCSAEERTHLREIEKLIKQKIDILENTKYPVTEKIPLENKTKHKRPSRKKRNKDFSKQKSLKNNSKENKTIKSIPKNKKTKSEPKKQSFNSFNRRRKRKVKSKN